MITREKLDRIRELQAKLKIAELREGLTDFHAKTNPNYKILHSSFNDQEYESFVDDFGVKQDKLVKGFKGVILEGSSRSGKTYAGIDFIIYLCTMVETSCKIFIVRETYNEMKTTLFDDISKRLDDFGLANPFHTSKEMQSFKIGKNKIFLVGADSIGKFHGATSDYVFFNEILHIDKEVFRQLTMRCNRFWWGDYNPSVTEHYVFDSVIPRADVGYLRTTFLDNAYLSIASRNEILMSEPWLPNSYEVIDNELWYKGALVSDSNQPPEHPSNVSEGTADEQYWRIYGLGLRGAMKGVIFKNVSYVDERPDAGYSYGLDFGFTVDPSVLTRNWEDENNIWIEYLTYAPIETPEEMSMLFDTLGIERHLPITCDSSDKFTGQNKGTVEMVRGLQELGWEVYKVSKTKSVMYWLNSMRRKKIHIIKNDFVHHAKKELENYKFKEIHGILINQPIDKYNHGIDSARYSHISQSHNYDIYY